MPFKRFFFFIILQTSEFEIKILQNSQGCSKNMIFSVLKSNTCWRRFRGCLLPLSVVLLVSWCLVVSARNNTFNIIVPQKTTNKENLMVLDTKWRLGHQRPEECVLWWRSMVGAVVVVNMIFFLARTLNDELASSFFVRY